MPLAHLRPLLCPDNFSVRTVGNLRIQQTAPNIALLLAMQHGMGSSMTIEASTLEL